MFVFFLIYITVLEITKKNCYKCDLETSIDNNSQYFWINLRDFEAETEINWLNIFNKQSNKSTFKYRRELTPNIKFQADRIFVRNDLFEKVIKSCKATSAEFLMFKEKLGICLYGELIQEIFEELDDYSDEESDNKFFEESDNESIEESTKKLIKESDQESTKKLTKVLIKEPTKKSNKESVNKSNKNSSERLEEMIEQNDKKFIEDLREPFSLNNNSTTNWYDKNKLNKILTTIDSNNFNHKNKKGKFKFNDINNLINNIKNNTISEADTKKKINELNEIKKVETKSKRPVDSQKILLKLVDDLVKAILNNSNNKIVNEDNNKIVKEDNNVNDNNDNDNESDDDYDSDNDYDSDDDHDEQYYEILQMNRSFKKIDETKSLEEQIDILKKLPCLYDYWSMNYYEDNKETFMINQLMTQLNNMMKLEKYQQDKVMITQLVVC